MTIRMSSTWLPFLMLLGCALPQSAQDSLTTKQVLDRASAASVQILTGEGGGRLQSIGTGVIISGDGVILTALHVVKNAAEVQVRLASGDTFDHVQLLGSDERRDIAALKVTGRGLAHLESATSTPPAVGDIVFAVTSAEGLGWSATSGIISALRPAEEVPGAGSGFRLIQFTAPVAPGASGAALVSRNGNLIGVITSGMHSGIGFAIPAESVLGLADSLHPVTLGSGGLLQPAAKQALRPSNSAAIAATDPKRLLHDAKTIYLHSKTSFLTIDTLQRALLANKQWPELGITIVGDPKLADLFVEVDRPLFTYVHTFVLSDRNTTVILGSGKETALDGTIASGALSKDIVKMLAGARLPNAGKQ